MQQATKLRKILIADAAALCERGYLKPTQLNELKLLNGYESTARDLDALGALLRRALPTVDGKSAVTLADLDLAADLSEQLRLELERRKQPKVLAAEANDKRVRAFTLLSKTYAEVQRTIRYLRASEGDAEVLMPPLCGRPWGRGL